LRNEGISSLAGLVGDVLESVANCLCVVIVIQQRDTVFEVVCFGGQKRGGSNKQTAHESVSVFVTVCARSCGQGLGRESFGADVVEKVMPSLRGQGNGHDACSDKVIVSFIQG
jgi:hypothetical protein